MDVSAEVGSALVREKISINFSIGEGLPGRHRNPRETPVPPAPEALGPVSWRAIRPATSRALAAHVVWRYGRG